MTPEFRQAKVIGLIYVAFYLADPCNHAPIQLVRAAEDGDMVPASARELRVWGRFSNVGWLAAADRLEF